MRRLCKTCWILFWLALVWLPGIISGEQYGEIHADGLYSIQGLWHLNDNSSPESDSSGNGNDGTVTGATYISNGIFSGAYSFDGSGDYIIPAYYTNASLASIVLWVKFDNISNEDIIAGAHDESDHRFYLGIYGGRYFFGAGDSYKGYSSGVSHDFVADIWYFLALVTNGSTASYYVDGVLVDSFSYSNSGQSTKTIAIGALNGVPVSNFLDGDVDEVCIWNTALSALEIRQIYAMQKGAYSE